MNNVGRTLVVGANGYIGSKLMTKLSLNGFNVVGIDSLLRDDDQADGDRFKIISYQNLFPEFLDEFDNCIWLAGHSSVNAARLNQIEALRNNLYDLIEFVRIYRGRLIYASSGSVYSRLNPERCREDAEQTQPSNIYDYTKICFDNFLAATGIKAIGLRFGTVAGSSQRIRNELIVNSMVKSCLENGELFVSNEKYYRPILWIDDLVQGIEKVLNSDVKNGIFNMASFESTIGAIANSVAEKLDSKVIKLSDTGTYNFRMEVSKFEQTFDFRFKGSLELIIDELCQGQA